MSIRNSRMFYSRKIWRKISVTVIIVMSFGIIGPIWLWKERRDWSWSWKLEGLFERLYKLYRLYSWLFKRLLQNLFQKIFKNQFIYFKNKGIVRYSFIFVYILFYFILIWTPFISYLLVWIFLDFFSQRGLQAIFKFTHYKPSFKKPMTFF